MAMAMIDFNLVGDHGRMWSLFSFTCFHISMSSSLLERSSNKSLTSGPQRVFPFFLTAQKRLRRCSMAAWERTLPLHTRRPFSSMVTSSSSSVLQSVLNNKISISKEIVWNLSRIYHNDKKKSTTTSLHTIQSYEIHSSNGTRSCQEDSIWRTAPMNCSLAGGMAGLIFIRLRWLGWLWRRGCARGWHCSWTGWRGWQSGFTHWSTLISFDKLSLLTLKGLQLLNLHHEAFFRLS